MALIVLNPTDASATRHRYILWFGAYGTTRFLVWANGLDDALDECVDYMAEAKNGMLGHIYDNEVFAAYKEALAAGKTEEEAQDYASEDMTQAGNYGNYIASWEWGIVAEDPDRATIKALQAEP